MSTIAYRSKKKNSKRSHHQQKAMMGVTYRAGLQTSAKIHTGKNFRKKSLKSSIKGLIKSIASRKGEKGES